MTASVAVALIHLALGYALVAGFGSLPRLVAETPLKVFRVREEVAVSAPPEVAAPQPRYVKSPPRTRGRSGASTTPRQLPPMIDIADAVSPPVILPTAPAAPPATAQEARDTTGNGSGSEGDGSGSGAAGTGDGSGGGIAVHAERTKGRIGRSDYPRKAFDDHEGGTVFLRIAVGADGRVSDCTIEESSGRADLDEATCSLIRQRWRYKPARDAAGRAVADIVHMAQVWETGQRH